MKIALITGASSGFGLLTAIKLAKNNYKIVASMRDLSKKTKLLNEIKKHNLHKNIEIIKLDVNNYEDIENCKKYIQSKYGKIDIIINNAGYCLSGFMEELSIDQIKNQFNTNVFGTIAMIQAFIPLMRKQKKGLIINIASILGRLGLPGMSAYTSSKFALEGLSESLRLELAPFGIKVVVIDPGAYKTNIWDDGLNNIKEDEESIYSTLRSFIYKNAKSFSDNSDNPQKVADLIYKITKHKNPKLRYTIGRGMKILLFLKNMIPFSVIELIFKKIINKK